jgi:hypothetical protein
MRALDWAVLLAAMAGIVLYGLWKGRRTRDLDDFLVADRRQRWYRVALSIMATQASAVTFLATPGQAYADGMRFVQVYFGLPVAMVVLSLTAVPLYRRLKVYTAYEYLEGRFDLKTRTLAALLFLALRGLSTGVSAGSTPWTSPSTSATSTTSGRGSRAAASSRSPTSAPTSRRCSATSRASRSRRAASGCSSTGW